MSQIQKQQGSMVPLHHYCYQQNPVLEKPTQM